MKIKFVIGFLLANAWAFGQLDTIDMSVHDFGIPSIAPWPDFVRQEMYYVNQAIRSIDSINNFIDVTDSSATMTTLVVDSIAAGAIRYTNTYYDDLRVPLTNTFINPLLSEPVFEDAGNGIWAFGFDADADSAEGLHFIAQLPHKYAEGTDIEIHFHWEPSTTNTGDVVWKIYYTIADIGDAFPAVDSMRVLDAGSGTSFDHQLVEFGDITGTGLSISAIIMGYVVRCGEATDDSYTGSAYGIELDFHYQVNSPGSSNESSK